MKRISFLTFALALLTSLPVLAQTTDPVVMRINGQNVTRSEFEYNYNKNNTDGVIDKKTVTEYAELFVNYKLKVFAALDAHLDTLTSYQEEFRTYRDQQIRPLLVSSEAEDQEVRDYYAKMVASLEGKQLILPAHIFVHVPQQSTQKQQDEAKARIDSIWNVLQGGADFGKLAAETSDDRGSAMRGGVIDWLGPHQLPKELDDLCYSMQKDETRPPFLSTVGWHIMRLVDTKPLDSYETLEPRIRQFLESRGMKDRLAAVALDSLVRQSEGKLTAEQIMDAKTEEYAAQDDELKYLIQEYHDGLLLYEICQRQVWEPAARDTAALVKFFKKNKKQYAYEKPHYSGALFQCREATQLAEVKKALKGKPEEQWANIITSRFNTDSVQVRMERRVFEQGENALVDSLAFKVREGKTRPNAKYPHSMLLGRLLKKGPKLWTDVSSQVVSDYQALKEKEFVDELRRRYKVEIFQQNLNTVNKH